ncbi:MAG: transketolase-like TK C-terminal-containing protein, partial [bacterium]
QEFFEAQNVSYRDAVLPVDVRARLAIEAGVTMGWERYVGFDGVVVGIDRFGASAPYQEVMEALGISVDNLVQKTLDLVSDQM